MQDIFCDEEYTPPRKSKSTRDNTGNDLIDYFLSRHVKAFGENSRILYSPDNRQRIAKFVYTHKLPYQHFVAFVFRELPDTKVFANMITSENWIPKYRAYVDSLKLTVEDYQLKSPHALPCWGEYLTFMSCLKSFVQNGKSPLELINNFIFSERMSNLTLDYIYRNLDMFDATLHQQFEQFRSGKVLPYEDIDNDINLLLQNYDN